MAPSIANVGGSGAGGLSSPLVLAVAASAALHVALLAGLPDLWTYSATPATAPLNARLARGAPEPAATMPEPSPPPAAEPAVPRPAASTRRPPAHAAPAAAPKPRESEAAASPARDPVAQVAAASPAAVGSAPAVGEPTAAPRPGDDALDFGSLAQFRLALIGTAKRYRLYPESAVERGWHGRVTVRLGFDAEGAVAAALVRRSSGHATLDEQALDMLRKAAALTPLPPALRGREFSVDVPVVFELRGEG